MNHLSTQNFILNQIGALEWGADFERPGDGALEAAGANVGPSPTITIPPACMGPTMVCRIDDGALEAAGASVGPVPLTMSPACGSIPTVVCRIDS